MQAAVKVQPALPRKLEGILLKADLFDKPLKLFTCKDSVFLRQGATKEDIRQIRYHYSRQDILLFKSGNLSLS